MILLKDIEINNPICVALDLKDRDSIDRMIEATQEHVGMFKIGLTTVYSVGIDYVREKEWPLPLFVDAKLHDIPVQVYGAVEAIRELGADLVTVHAAGGQEMLRAAVKAAAGELGILSVTLLTSLNQHDLEDLDLRPGAAEIVERWSELAIASDVDGLVCSPLEVKRLRARFGPRSQGGPLIVTPGVRPEGSSVGDQRRVLTPGEAVEAGADVLVIGRPITAAADPGAAAAAVRAEVSP